MPARARLLSASVAVALPAVAFTFVHRHGGAARSAPGEALPAAALPAPVHPAFVPRTPRPLRDGAAAASFAPVLRAVVARAAPAATSHPLARVERSTPEKTTNIVLVLARRVDRDGRVWVKVSLPVLPNGTVGWVPRRALGGYVYVRTRLVVDLRRRSATLLENGRRVFTAPVGVGKPAWPTPRGHFYVRERLTSFRDPMYGPIAFGTSARSTTLTDWPGGGYVGIHGTNQPELIPGRVSHGCIRLRNRDILRLSRLMPVGTPVTIR